MEKYKTLGPNFLVPEPIPDQCPQSFILLKLMTSYVLYLTPKTQLVSNSRDLFSWVAVGSLSSEA